MSSDEVAQLTLLITAANAQINLEILDVSKQLLLINEQHLKAFIEYKEMMEKNNARHL